MSRSTKNDFRTYWATSHTSNLFKDYLVCVADHNRGEVQLCQWDVLCVQGRHNCGLEECYQKYQDYGGLLSNHKIFIIKVIKVFPIIKVINVIKDLNC